MPHRDPLAMFFKLPSDASPVAVLGLRAGHVSDDDIIVARARRLEIVDQHPLSGTPDADEARLAVHTAAARLLQQAAMHRTQPPAEGSGVLPRPQPRLGVPQAAAALDRETLLLVGLAGGWSPRVLTRLAAIAITRGLGTKDAIAAAMRLASKPNGSPAGPRISPAPRPVQPSAQSFEPQATPQDQAAQGQVLTDEDLLENWLKTVLVIAGSVGVTLAILVVGAVWALSTLNSSKATATEGTGEVAVTTPAPSDRIAPPRENVYNADLVLYELTAAESLAQTKRSLQAVSRVDAALGHWLGQWPAHPPGSWRRVLEKLVPLIERIRTDPAGDTALATVLARSSPDPGQPLRAEDVPRQVALAAVLASLGPAPESKVSAALTDTWRSRTPYAVPTGATPAAKEALRAVARGHLARTPEAYDAWARCAQGISRIVAESPESLLLAGASDLLGRIEPPTEGERDAIRAMTERLDWRSGSTARAWLLARLNDRTVHAARIATAVNTLAQSTSAPGIPTSLNLDTAASWDDRYQMSRTLADVWGLRVSINRDLFIRDWLERADALLDEPRPTTDQQTISRLGDLAYLNTAAAFGLLGQNETAVSSLSRSSSRQTRFEPLSPLFSRVGESPLTHAAGQGDNDALLQRLGVIKDFGASLSHADAATLAELAFRGRNEVVRTAASDALRPIAISPEIILATLETSPLITDTATNRSLLTLVAGDSVEPAPGQSWGDALHLALARSLLSRTTSPAAVIDDTARRVREAYAAARTIAPVRAQDPLTEHVRAMANAQLARVNPDLGPRPITTPAQIVSLRDTRLRVARSPVQRFAIELHALAAATVLAATSNNAAIERPAQTLWDELLESRANADSALDQALATERMLTRLYAIILTADPEASGPAPTPRQLAPGAPAASPPTEPSGEAIELMTMDLASRLQRLTPETPAAYLDVADELIADGRETLAVHTLVVAVFLASDRGDTLTTSSACLALATLTPDSEQRELLRALADTVNPRLNRPAWLDPSRSHRGHDAASLGAAQALLDLRRGRGEHALDMLRDEAARETLAAQPELNAVAAARRTSTLSMLSGIAREWPCPECANDRTVRPRGQTELSICPRCDGHPGPELSEAEQIAWLTAEVRLLSPQEPWSSALLLPGHNAPVAEPSLSIIPTFFRVNPSLSLYRNGQWVRP
ncbi:MAG: hypothetical protein ACI89L_000155 [Phycisphaerales bacterium]|jgi:hypothetical protein